jgi:hypothetical protein
MNHELELAEMRVKEAEAKAKALEMELQLKKSETPKGFFSTLFWKP